MGSNTIERFRFVQSVIGEIDEHEVLQKLANADNNTLRHSAFTTNKTIDELNSNKFYSGILKLKKYQPDYIQIDVTLNQGTGFLVVANSWNQYWESYIDGQKVKSYKVNYVQYGIKVERGQHNVEFRYNPPYRKYF